MYTLTIEEQYLFDEEKNEFITIKKQHIVIEHSLKSLYAWESKWKKSFLSTENKTREETIDYIKCMTISPKVDNRIYDFIGNKEITEVYNYINDPMTATTFNDKDKKSSREIITAEIIYYDMIQCQIPFECEKWHLNKLMTLIKVCSLKNTPDKKMGKSELATRNHNLNAARRAKHLKR